MSYQKNRVFFFICFGFLGTIGLCASDIKENSLLSVVPGFCSVFDGSPCTQLQYAINVCEVSGVELDKLLQQPEVDLFKSVQLIMRDGEIEVWLDKGQKPYLGHMYARRNELRDTYVLCSRDVPQKVVDALDNYLMGNEKILLALLKSQHDIPVRTYVKAAFLETVYRRFSDIL